MYNDKVVKRDDLLSRKVRRLQVRQTKRNRQREREKQRQREEEEHELRTQGMDGWSECDRASNFPVQKLSASS